MGLMNGEVFAYSYQVVMHLIYHFHLQRINPYLVDLLTYLLLEAQSGQLELLVAVFVVPFVLVLAADDADPPLLLAEVSLVDVDCCV